MSPLKAESFLQLVSKENARDSKEIEKDPTCYCWIAVAGGRMSMNVEWSLGAENNPWPAISNKTGTSVLQPHELDSSDDLDEFSLSLR